MTTKNYVIARPIENVSLNGYEYLLDDNNEVIVFATYQEAYDYIAPHVPDEEPNDYIHETPL
jgi:hypothetical protein